MSKKTEQLNEVLEFVTSYLTDYGRAPSVREIVAGTGVKSTSTANRTVDELVDLGLLVKDDEIARGINLPGNALDAQMAKDLADAEEELRLLRMQLVELQAEVRDGTRTSMVWIERWAALVAGSHELVKLLSPESERPLGAADDIKSWYWSTDLNMPVMVGNQVRPGVMSCLVLPRDLAYHMMNQPHELDVEDLVPLMLGVDEI